MTNINVTQNIGNLKHSIDFDISQQIQKSDSKDIAHLMAYVVDLKKTENSTRFLYLDKRDKPLFDIVEQRIISEIFHRTPKPKMTVTYGDKVDVEFQKIDINLDFPEISIDNRKMASILEKYKSVEFVSEVENHLNVIGNQIIENENLSVSDVTKKIAQIIASISTEYPGYTIGAKVFTDSESGLETETVNILPALLNAEKDDIMIFLSEIRDYVNINNSNENVSLFDSRNTLLGLVQQDTSAMGASFSDAVFFANDRLVDINDYIDITINDAKEAVSVLAKLRPDAIEYIQEVSPNILKKLLNDKTKNSGGLEM